MHARRAYALIAAATALLPAAGRAEDAAAAAAAKLDSVLVQVVQGDEKPVVAHGAGGGAQRAAQRDRDQDRGERQYSRVAHDA